MKININDDIVDLEKVYKISKIYDNDLSNNNKWIYFKIYFINKDEIKIGVHYNNILDNIYQNLIKVRKDIIKHWSENKTIPEFKTY